LYWLKRHLVGTNNGFAFAGYPPILVSIDAGGFHRLSIDTGKFKHEAYFPAVYICCLQSRGDWIVNDAFCWLNVFSLKCWNKQFRLTGVSLLGKGTTPHRLWWNGTGFNQMRWHWSHYLLSSKLSFTVKYLGVLSERLRDWGSAELLLKNILRWLTLIIIR
jgi:hypothetical protein